MSTVHHLYLHAPFCRRRCPYCDYAVTVDTGPNLDAWTTALGREMKLQTERGVIVASPTTVLVGGGTPSLLGAGAMDAVLSILGGVDFGGVEEWTAEANPEDVDESLLRAWRRAGVTRPNLGLQSLHGPALEWLGRSHDPETGRRALESLSDAGFPSWGVDLLFGLPEDVDPDPRDALGEVLAAGARHVSLYELVAGPGTPLGERVAAGEIHLPDDDARADQFLTLRAILVSAGYEHYELTGFARPGHRSRHMTGLLRGGSWLGLGPGAHSNLGGSRTWNLADWTGYSMAVASGALPEARSIRLGADEEREERFYSSLRSIEGLALSELGPSGRLLAVAWIERGLASSDAGRLRLTQEGWLRLDELSLEMACTEADSRYLFRSPGS